MQLSRFIYDEFIYGGHLLSIGASCIALTTMLLFNLGIRFEFLVIAYLGTQCIYVYNYYKEFDYDKICNHCRTFHMKKLFDYIPILLSIYGILYVLLLILYGNVKSIIFGICLLSIGLFFTIKGKDTSKNITGFKTVYTAFSWSLLVLFTLIFYSKMLFNLSIIFFILFVFIRWIINTSLFDLKDMESDELRELKTLPLKMGREKFLFFIQTLNLLSIVPILVAILFFNLPVSSIVLTLIFFYTFFYIYRLPDEKNELTKFSHIIVDGEYFFWPILLIFSFLIFN